MAYTVHFIDMDTNRSHLAHSPTNQNVKLYNTLVEQSVKEIDRFQFSIANDHPASIHIKELKTLVVIRNTETKDIEFEGRILKQAGEFSNHLTERGYKAEDCIGFLHDSKQMPQTITGKPSEILRFIVNRHNSLVEGYKQFAVGVCELDSYMVYSDNPDDQLVRVELKPHDNATISPNATTIYNAYGGTPLRMADYIKGVTLRVEGSQYVGDELFYLLYRMINGNKIMEGIVSERDILETLMTESTELVDYDVPFPPGTPTKIKSGTTTYYGAADGGGATSIPSNYLTYNYKIRAYAEDYDMYSIEYNGVAIAWLPPESLVFEERNTRPVEPSETTGPSKVDGRFPVGTKATIRSGVTTYYWSADGTGPTTIPQAYRTKTYIVREYSSYYKRYAIYTDGYLVAWINESDLDFGQQVVPSKPIIRPVTSPRRETARKITVELDYRTTSYDAIQELLLKPFRAELEWETIEGVRTLHIRKRIENETGEALRVGTNVISMRRDFDPSDIATVLIPIGRVPRDENDSDSGGSGGRLSQPTATNYDSSKSSGATVLRDDGWSESWVNQFRMNAADPPYINGPYIDTWLREFYPDSPLIGAGQLIKDMSDYFGIAVGAALGVWAKETTFGRGEPGKSNYNYGCIKHTGEFPAAWWNGIAWNDYPSQRVGIAEWFQLARDYYVNLGYVDYNAFVNRYSPTSDGNDLDTFKNLMWGTLKSFGYDISDSQTKRNYSTAGEDTSSIDLSRGGSTGGGSDTGGGGSAPAPNTSDQKREAAVQRALSFVGRTPYVWGGTTTSGWDCSGIVYEVYRHAGFPINHRCTTYTIYGETPPFKKITASEAKRGDLVVQHDVGHVAILLGPPSSGAGIVHAATPALGTITQTSITNVNGYFRVME